MTTKLLIIFGAVLVIGFIYLRHYVQLEKGVKLGAIFFRPKNLFRHREEEVVQEITVDAMIPAEDQVEVKDKAKGDTFVRRADVQLQKGELQEAEKLLIQAIAVDESSCDAYKRLGLIYLRQGQFGKAEEIYRKLVMTITDDATLFSNLGMALYSQQKLEEAKEFYEKAIEHGDERAGRFFSLGKVLHELEDIENALNNYQKALALDPSNLDYLLSIAHFYVEQGMATEAKQLLSEILAQNPENEAAQEMLQGVE